MRIDAENKQFVHEMIVNHIEEQAKIKAREVIHETTMPIPAVLELQVKSESVPTIHIRDEASVLEKDSGYMYEMLQHDSENIESQENKVSNSFREPSLRIDELQSRMLEKKTFGCGTFSGLCCNQRAEEWIPVEIEQIYVLDVVEEFTQKAVEATDLVEHHLFDQWSLRKLKSQKDWKFKYKFKKQLRCLVDLLLYTSVVWKDNSQQHQIVRGLSWKELLAGYMEHVRSIYDTRFLSHWYDTIHGRRSHGMQKWVFKTWKYKYKESEHKKISKSCLLEESKKIGQLRQEDLSSDETIETKAENLCFSHEMKYIQIQSLIQDLTVQIFIEEEELRDESAFSPPLLPLSLPHAHLQNAFLRLMLLFQHTTSLKVLLVQELEQQVLDTTVNKPWHFSEDYLIRFIRSHTKSEAVSGLLQWLLLSFWSSRNGESLETNQSDPECVKVVFSDNNKSQGLIFWNHKIYSSGSSAHVQRWHRNALEDSALRHIDQKRKLSKTWHFKYKLKEELQVTTAKNKWFRLMMQDQEVDTVAGTAN